MFIYAVGLCAAGEIFVQFRCSNVDSGPVRITFPGKGIGVRWNVARTTMTKRKDQLSQVKEKSPVAHGNSYPG